MNSKFIIELLNIFILILSLVPLSTTSYAVRINNLIYTQDGVCNIQQVTDVRAQQPTPHHNTTWWPLSSSLPELSVESNVMCNYELPKISPLFGDDIIRELHKTSLLAYSCSKSKELQVNKARSEFEVIVDHFNHLKPETFVLDLRSNKIRQIALLTDIGRVIFKDQIVLQNGFIPVPYDKCIEIEDQNNFSHGIKSQIEEFEGLKKGDSVILNREWMNLFISCLSIENIFEDGYFLLSDGKIHTFEEFLPDLNRANCEQ